MTEWEFLSLPSGLYHYKWPDSLKKYGVRTLAGEAVIWLGDFIRNKDGVPGRSYRLCAYGHQSGTAREAEGFLKVSWERTWAKVAFEVRSITV